MCRVHFPSTHRVQQTAETAEPSTGADARAAVDALAARAWALRCTDAEAAADLAAQALEAAGRAGYRRGEGYALRALGTARCLRFALDEADTHLARALRIFEEEGDELGRASVLNAQGSVLWRRADFAAALRAHLAALALCRAAGDRQGESDALNFIGNVHYHVGEFALALEAYRESERIKEELSDRLGLSQVVNNIGNIHGQLGDYAQALTWHARALELKRACGDEQGAAVSLVNLGSSHEALGELERAAGYYREALAQARRVGEKFVEADALRDLGDVHRKKGETERALALYAESLEVGRAAGLPFFQAETLLGTGRALLAAGRAGEALERLGEALGIARGIHSLRLAYETHREMSGALERLGDLRGALEHFRAFHEVEDEVFSAESEKRIQAILVQAEIERSHREAGLLRQANEELTQANQALREAEERLRRQAEELDRLAHEDALTGLFNRRHVDARLALEWERARRFGRELAVALVDLDHFKQVNDRFSHAVGDEVLRVVARLLREGTRAVDVAGRYGGEEFVLLLVETPPQEALRICERLRAAVEHHDWDGIAPGLAVTMSLGLCGDLSLDSPERMLAAADARLYQAKRAGRNRIF